MIFQKKIVLILSLISLVLLISNCGNSGNQTSVNRGDYPPAPSKLMNASLTKLDGSTFKLTDYKGKVLVVNVWATWCGPCRIEIPHFVKLQDELKDKGFEIVGLNVDEEDTPEMIKEFGKEMNVNYDLVKSDENLFGEFLYVSKQNAIPQSFLIDREGRLLGVFVGGGDKTVSRLTENVKKIIDAK